MKHSLSPGQLVGMQLEGEGCLRKVASRHMQIMELVYVADVHLLSVDLILIEILKRVQEGQGS